MNLEQAIRPVSYVKAHLSQIINDMAENPGIVVITQNGEAKAVLHDIHEYELEQECLAMLKLIVQSRKSIDAGKVKPAVDVFRDLRPDPQ